MKSELEARQRGKMISSLYIFDRKNCSKHPRGCFWVRVCVVGALPVVMSKHGTVTVAKVQTPDLQVSVSGAGGNNCVILDLNENTGSESGRQEMIYITILSIYNRVQFKGDQ